MNSFLNTVGWTLECLVLLPLAAMCAGCKAPSEVQGFENLAAAYDAAATSENKRPTMADAVVRAAASLQPPDVSVDVRGVLSSRRGQMLLLRPRRARELAPGMLQRGRKNLIAKRKALAEVRRARHLPIGLIPMDLEAYYRGGECPPHVDACMLLAMHLGRAVSISLWEGRATDARELAADALRTERVLHDAPPILWQISRVRISELVTRAYLEVALKGELPADVLNSMMSELHAAEPDVFVAVERIIRLERAWALLVMRRVADGDAKMTGQLLDVLGKEEHADSVREMAQALCAQLPEDRRSVLALYDGYEKALAHSPGRLSDSAPQALGTIGRTLQPPLARFQNELLTCLARRRAAVMLLRALAFRSKKGRFPRTNELQAEEDPYQPGQILVFEYDAQNRRVSAYSRGWRTKDRQSSKECLIGYTLMLEP